MRYDDDTEAQLFFGSTVVCCLLMVALLMLTGCESLGLADKNDGSPGFWRGLERQQNLTE